jgi:hypothetical protein
LMAIIDARVEEIVLTPLGLDDIGQLVADAVHCQPRSINALADCTQDRDDLEGSAAERHRNSARPELPPAEVDFPLIARIHQICSRFRHLPSSENLFASRRFSERHALRPQLLKQGAGGLHIRGRETFGEPIINRDKQRSRLVAATLAHPQTGNAEGDPQLPK